MRGRGPGRRRCSKRWTFRRACCRALVEPGTVVGHACSSDACAGVRRARRSSRPPATTPGRRSRRCAPAARRAFISSGTWSLLGTELDAPVITAAGARPQLHERGRRLRDDAAAEEHRRAVAAAGVPAVVGRGGARSRLRRAARRRARSEPHAFRSLFDPDHRGFFQPPDMVGGDRRLLPADRPAGAGVARRRYARAILESLAFKYRVVLESLEELTGTPLRGNPHRRRRIAQPPAEPVHRRRDRPHRGRRPGRGDGARQHRDADARDRRGRRRSPRRGRSSSDRSRSSASSRSRADAGTLTTRAFSNTWR